jgi:2-polyprenyl-6-methoxyphenol hydroxylase-like FAD-dependent oxidoreductase
MGSLLPSWDKLKPISDEPNSTFLAQLWNNESGKYKIKMNGNIWINDPIKSSNPSSLAYYAALNQGRSKASLMLRTIREKIFLQEKNVGKTRILVTAAIESKLNVNQFLKDYRGAEVRELFNLHLKAKRNQKISVFPTLIFENSVGETATGIDPTKANSFEDIYDNWVEIIDRLIDKDSYPIKNKIGILQLLEEGSRMSTSEIQVICEYNSEEETNTALEATMATGFIIKENHQSVDYWRYNNTVFPIKKDKFKINNAAIIGGGVCGYHLALLLNKSGLETTIYEQQKNNNNKGFGFVLLKNGLDAMDSIGLKNEVLKQGNSINFIKAIKPSGDQIFSAPLDNCLAISRGDFFDVLIKEYGESHVQFGKSFSEVLCDDQKKIKSIKFADNTEVEADLFVATDGIWSKVRHQLFKESKLEQLDKREIVALVNIKDLDEKADEFIKVMDADAGKYMGFLPLDHDNYIWFIQFNNASQPIKDNSPESIKAYAENTVSDYPDLFKTLVKHTDFEKSFLWVSHRMNILPKFHLDNLILAGDAAHPLLPLTSQGANTALEDAAFLASLLSDQKPDESLESVFNKFYETRKTVIQSYIDDGDLMLKDFLNLPKNKKFKIPLSI